MHNRAHRLVGAFGVAAVAALAAAPAGSAAGGHSTKTAKIRSTCVGKLVGSNVSKGTCHSTLGTYTFSVTLSPPNAIETDTYKNGKLSVHSTVKLASVHGHPEAVGTWKVTGGTGAYKHASGGGTETTILNGTTTTTTLIGSIHY